MVIIPSEILNKFLPLQCDSQFNINSHSHCNSNSNSNSTKHQQQKQETISSGGYHNGHTEMDDINESPRKKRKLCNGHSQHNGHDYSNHNGHNTHCGYNEMNGHSNNHNHNIHKIENKDDNQDSDLLHIPKIKKEVKLDDNDNGSRHRQSHSDKDRVFLEPLIVKIAFTIREPIDGIHWVVPRDMKDGSPSISPSLSLSPSANNSRSSSVALSSPSKSPTKPTFRKRTWGEMNYDDVNEEQKLKDIAFPDRKPRMFRCNVSHNLVKGLCANLECIINRYVYL